MGACERGRATTHSYKMFRIISLRGSVQSAERGFEYGAFPDTIGLELMAYSL